MINKKHSSIDAYDTSYFAERDYLPLHMLNVLEILLEKRKVKSILEVGVGSGKLMKVLKKKKYSVEGIDISPVSAKLTGAKVASATKIPFNANKFDCVIGISIIEHLTQKEGHKFITEARRVLKNGGIIFLVTPNFSSPMRLIQKDQWFAYSDKTHVFFYTPGTLKKLLNQYNFYKITSQFKVEISEVEFPLPSFIMKSPPSMRKFINYLFISSPLALWRDSFWIEGTVKK